MIVYAGIDEAGYGPVLGPLVVARSVFLVERADPGSKPTSLWATLRSAVCRSHGDPRGRIAIGDSKTLYSPSTGLSRIERGVLSFLLAAGEQPLSLDQLLAVTAFDEASTSSEQPWYAGPEGRPELPVRADTDDLMDCAFRLSGAASRTGVVPEHLSAAVVFEDRFNRMVEASGSKAACEWEFVAGHLRSIWEKYAGHHPYVAVDSLGGRKDYRGLLATSLPWVDVVPTADGGASSAYRLIDRGHEMRVIFRVRCEETHLPVALASMFAKYVRELFMLRFRAYWQKLAPKIRPTYGYLPDGNRFVEEIEPLLSRLGIKRESMVRSR
jgi:hypothetical protein